MVASALSLIRGHRHVNQVDAERSDNPALRAVDCSPLLCPTSRVDYGSNLFSHCSCDRSVRRMACGQARCSEQVRDHRRPNCRLYAHCDANRWSSLHRSHQLDYCWCALLLLPRDMAPGRAHDWRKQAEQARTRH